MKITDQIFDIASLLVGVALITLLINRADSTAAVIKAATAGFRDILKTITLQ